MSASGTVKATSGSVSGTAAVTVTNHAPTVATPAAATPSTVTGTTTALSVLGADDAGESNLTYTWAATSVPAGRQCPHLFRQRHQRLEEYYGDLFRRRGLHLHGDDHRCRRTDGHEQRQRDGQRDLHEHFRFTFVRQSGGGRDATVRRHGPRSVRQRPGQPALVHLDGDGRIDHQRR